MLLCMCIDFMKAFILMAATLEAENDVRERGEEKGGEREKIEKIDRENIRWSEHTK